VAQALSRPTPVPRAWGSAQSAVAVAALALAGFGVALPAGHVALAVLAGLGGWTLLGVVAWRWSRTGCADRQASGLLVLVIGAGLLQPLLPAGLGPLLPLAALGLGVAWPPPPELTL